MLNGERQVSHLEHMSPVLAFVIQTFVKHFHDLYEILSERTLLNARAVNWIGCYALIKRQASNLIHESTCWSPRIVGRCIADFSLDI